MGESRLRCQLPWSPVIPVLYVSPAISRRWGILHAKPHLNRPPFDSFSNLLFYRFLPDARRAEWRCRWCTRSEGHLSISARGAMGGGDHSPDRGLRLRARASSRTLRCQSVVHTTTRLRGPECHRGRTTSTRGPRRRSLCSGDCQSRLAHVHVCIHSASSITSRL